MLDIVKKANRKPTSFTLKPRTIELVKELADKYDTTSSRVIESMIVKYAPLLIKGATKDNAL